MTPPVFLIFSFPLIASFSQHSRWPQESWYLGRYIPSFWPLRRWVMVSQGIDIVDVGLFCRSVPIRLFEFHTQLYLAIDMKYLWAFLPSVFGPPIISEGVAPADSSSVSSTASIEPQATDIALHKVIACPRTIYPVLFIQGCFASSAKFLIGRKTMSTLRNASTRLPSAKSALAAVV